MLKQEVFEGSTSATQRVWKQTEGIDAVVEKYYTEDEKRVFFGIILADKQLKSIESDRQIDGEDAETTQDK